MAENSDFVLVIGAPNSSNSLRLVEVATRLGVPARLIQRADDTPGAINKRLDLYDQQTSPLIDYYRAKSLLAVVSGVGTPDEVFARLLAAVQDVTKA